MMKHLKECDEDTYDGIVRCRNADEKKADNIITGPSAKKTTYKNTMDMGFPKFRLALNHLKLVMNKTLSRW